MSEEIQNTLDTIASQIKELHIGVCKDVAEATKQAFKAMQNAAEVGRLLLEAKALCRQGDFQDFVELRLGLHRRTAQRYIAAYHRRAELPSPAPLALQASFDLIDFKPATSVASSNSKPGGVYRFTAPFWDFIEKANPAKWTEDERGEFLNDTARRVGLAKEQGWIMPPIPAKTK